MPAEKTEADAIGILLTGSTAVGSTQNDADLSLGGNISGTEMAQYDGYFITPIPNLIVLQTSGDNGDGTGTLFAVDENTLSYAAPGESLDSTNSQAIANGETKTIEGTDKDKFLRVERDTAVGISGDMGIQLRETLNNVVGMDNVTEAERAAGTDTYRAFALKAHGPQNVTLLKLWIGELATSQTSDGGQLPGAGQGSITTTGSFTGWAEQGWVHIRTVADVLREIAYYTDRTDTVLTVIGLGRGLLGTSASAGAADDTIHSVPGIRIGKETPVDGAIQTIANESTAPAGITWNAEITAALGVDVGSLNASSTIGIWIHRDMPVGASGDVSARNLIKASFTANTSPFTASYRGRYRVTQDSLEQFELYVGEDADPDFTATPDEVSPSLPFTHALTPPASGTTEFRMVVRKRNQYGLLSKNVFVRSVTIDDLGAQVVNPLSAPEDVSANVSDGGNLSLFARYYPERDSSPADNFAIYVAEGVDPDPLVDTPVLEPMVETFGFFSAGRRLNKVLGPFAETSDLRVLVRSHRSSDSAESANTTATQVTMTTLAPAIPGSRLFGFGDSFRQRNGAPSNPQTIFIDQPNNVRFETDLGFVELFFDTTLVWRWRRDILAPDGNEGVWTTFGFRQEAISGTPGTVTNGVEVASFVSATEGVMFIPVAGERRMKIDVTNSTIHCAAMRAIGGSPRSRNQDPVHQDDHFAMFQVQDLGTFDFETAATLDQSGIWLMNVGFRQRATTGEFE